MRIFMVFVIIWLWAYVISLLADKDFAQCLPVAVMGQIAVLYLFGYAGVLKLGVYVVCLLPFTAFTYIVVKYRERIKPDVQLLVTTAVFGAVFVCFWYIQLGMMISQWDEFTHWGLIVKNMYRLDNFGNTGFTTAAFLDYPPGQGLFRYFFMKICGAFAESRIFHAANIMAVVFAFPLLRKNKNLITSSLAVLMYILVLNTVSAETFHTIYIDLLLGVVWAHLLYICFAYEKDSFFYIDFTLTFVFLALLKASGFGLALSVLIVTVIHVLCTVKDRKRLFSQLVPLALASVTGIAVKLSWSAYLNIHNINPIFEFNALTPATFMELFTGGAPQYRYDVISSFIHALFHTPVFYIGDFGVTAVIFTLVTTAVLCLMGLIGKKDRNSLWAGFGVFMVAAIFITGMLISYLFSFSEYEAVILASYDRYLRTIAMGAVTTVFMFAAEKMLSLKATHATVLMLVFTLLLGPKVLLRNIVTRPATVASIQAQRAVYIRESEIVQRNAPGYVLMAYIAPGTNGYEFWQGKYECSPAMIWGQWSFSATEGGYFDGDIWTVTKSAEELQSELNTYYDYVFIHSVNEKFINDYSSIFADGTAVPGLYRIDDTTGMLSLMEAMPA
ncbi:MAG: hypothetical protein IJ410_04240 [Oscillospiraceae bacterium]|nr:hypothetical protein [Oscillospiraceae bacterium]